MGETLGMYIEMEIPLTCSSKCVIPNVGPNEGNVACPIEGHPGIFGYI